MDAQGSGDCPFLKHGHSSAVSNSQGPTASMGSYTHTTCLSRQQVWQRARAAPRDRILANPPRSREPQKDPSPPRLFGDHCKLAGRGAVSPCQTPVGTSSFFGSCFTNKWLSSLPLAFFCCLFWVLFVSKQWAGSNMVMSPSHQRQVVVLPPTLSLDQVEYGVTSRKILWQCRHKW